jgi:hypothetical protein
MKPIDTRQKTVNSAIESAPEDMQAKIAQWEAYLVEQQRLRLKAAAEVQQIMDVSGLSAKGVHPSDPAFAQLAFDLEFQKQVSLQYGLKLEPGEPIDRDKADASMWRQRTSALKV